MLVKVVEKNKEKINKILADANGKAWRRVLDYESLLAVVKVVQDRLKQALGSRSALYGAKINYTPNEIFPKSYQYEASGTCVSFHFDKNGDAVLTCAYRDRLSKYTWKQYVVEYTDKQIKLMLQRASRF